MNDNKEKYHVMVLAQKETVIKKCDTKTANKITAGHKRKEQFHANWEKVNLNDIVEKFAPMATPNINEKGTKISWENTKTQISVVCDIGGGYLRIQDISVINTQKHARYFDLNGKLLANTTKPNGKQRGLTKAEKNALSHFLIKKREEM